MTNISSFRPLRDNVFVTSLDTSAHVTRGGVILLDDNMTDRGIHPRWCRVWAIGPDVTEVGVGEWLLVKHARWTNSMTIDTQDDDGQPIEQRIWRVEWPEAVLLASAEDPRDTIRLVDAHKSHAHHPHYLGARIAR